MPGSLLGRDFYLNHLHTTKQLVFLSSTVESHNTCFDSARVSKPSSREDDHLEVATEPSRSRYRRAVIGRVQSCVYESLVLNHTKTGKKQKQ